VYTAQFNSFVLDLVSGFSSIFVESILSGVLVCWKKKVTAKDFIWTEPANLGPSKKFRSEIHDPGT